MTTVTTTRKAERGNALFLILIAVALFAALSYAVTQSGRGSGSVSKETAVLDSAQLTQFPAVVRTAVTRLVLTGIPTTGTDKVALNLKDNSTSAVTCDGGSANCCSGNNCVFETSGGGVITQAPPSSAIQGVGAASGTVAGPAWRYKTIKTGGNSFYVRGISTTAGDAFAFIGVNPNACRAINRGLGLTAEATITGTQFASTADTGEGQSTTQAASGSAAEGNNSATIGGTSTALAFACVANITSGPTDSDPRIYYHTLLEQ